MPLGLIVFFGSIIVFFRRIGTFPLRNWDEAWYAEIIKNMASGNWGYLIPYWNGRYYFDHSPLYFWLSSPFFKFFGPGEWQARVVSAAAAVIATFLVYLIGKKLSSERVGFLSSVIFLTFGGVVIRFAHGNLDALLSCLFLAAFYFYLRSKDKTIFSVLCGISIGLGVLVKSWGIGVFPAYLIACYSLLSRRQLPTRAVLILFVAFLTFFWWYLLGIKNFGQEFINWFILNPSENRLGSPFANFSLDYFKFAVRDIGLWFLPLVIFVIAYFKKYLDVKDDFIVPFLFVSLTYIVALNFLSDKSDWYVIPALPFLAIVLGYICDRLLRLNFRLSALFISLILLVQYFNVLRIENIYPDRSIIGAELGVKAREIIPLEDEVILDDHDFTAFLYYSNQNHIYTMQNERKPSEWWILKGDEISDFIAKNPKTWIITRDAEKFGQLKATDKLGDYTFLRKY